tara:strand:- start:1187 stop:1651 length:465 start_codon:yes stop_codon:yes gene_type:complete
MKNTEDDFIKENYGLAVSLARRFYSRNHNYDFEDIIQVALMSMLKAYRKHDPKRSVFSTFATFCIRNDLIKFIKKQHKNKDMPAGEIFSSIVTYDKNDIEEIFPDNLDIQEQAIFYYKRSNYKDMEIRDILNMSKQEYKCKIRLCYNKLRIINE